MSLLCWGLQSWTQDSRWVLTRAEGQNHLPQPAGHASLDAAQGTVGFPGCEHILLAHVQLFFQQYPQVLLSRAALNTFIPQPVLIPGFAPTQMQDLALGLMRFTQALFSSLSRSIKYFYFYYTDVDTEVCRLKKSPRSTSRPVEEQGIKFKKQE